MTRKRQNKKSTPTTLTGWKQITDFLGQPHSVAQRWAKAGMPVTKQGRFVSASPEQLNEWLGRESAGEPIHVATDETDLAAELKRGLSYVRRHPRRST